MKKETKKYSIARNEYYKLSFMPSMVMSKKNLKSCSKPFHENFKDESPLLLFIFAIIASFILRRKRSHYSTVNSIGSFDELDQGYDYEGKYVEMDNPRRCSYNKKTDSFGVPEETVIIGNEIRSEISPNVSTLIIPMPVEFRGITLRQLRAIIANVKRRCVKERWVSTKDNKTLLTPDTVTMYDINKYVIMPFTMESEASFVETLPSTAGTQPPKFFVSHTWGTPFYHTTACIQQLIEDFKVNRIDKNDNRRGGGMTEDTPIWICAFANNQHHVQNAIPEDISETGFSKAMEVANYRTLFILDKDGNAFSRIWCLLEIYLTLIQIQVQIQVQVQVQENENEKGDDLVEPDCNGLLAMYTAHAHTWYQGTEFAEERKAVGIIQGGATSDSSFANITAFREQHFPIDRILNAVTIMVETAVASIGADKKHILNVLAGNIDNLDAEPPKEHTNYAALNEAVQDAFASSILALRALQASSTDA